MSFCSVTAGIWKNLWYPSPKNIRIWIWSEMYGQILSCMICHRNGQDEKADRQDMGTSSPSKQILFFLIKRLTVILSPSARSLQICLVAGRYWHMSLPRNQEVEKRNFFSVRFFRNSCRFSVPGRRRHPWSGPAVHGWNIFLYSFMDSVGT